MITGPLLHLRRAQGSGKGVQGCRRRSRTQLLQTSKGSSGSPQKSSAHQSLAPAALGNRQNCVGVSLLSPVSPGVWFAAFLLPPACFSCPDSCHWTDCQSRQLLGWDEMLGTTAERRGAALKKTLYVPESLSSDPRDSYATLMVMIFLEMERDRAEQRKLYGSLATAGQPNSGKGTSTLLIVLFVYASFS